MPLDTKTERWLRRQAPCVELAMRYALRGRFRDGDRAMDARINWLYQRIAPTGEEHAAILKLSREIGTSMKKELHG